MRVLMLGWEFPPRISGGLGTACEGIVRGLVAAGAEVQLVLPRLGGDEPDSGARLLSASDVPVERTRPAQRLEELGDRLQVTTVASPLRPYQTSRDYRRVLERMERFGHASDRPAALEGGYGPDLASEVERYAHAVARIAARERFDVIHAHDWMTYPAGLLARRVSGRPLVAHLHASEWDRAGADGDPGILAIEQAGLGGADRVVCVSHFTRRVVERHYRVDPLRIRVVHNAVRRGVTAPALSSRMSRAVRLADLSGAPAPAPAAAPAPGGGAARPAERPPTVLFLGRLTRQKGPDFFLEAAGLVHARRPDVRFLVAGDGDLRARLVEETASSGLARRVFFTGFLSPEDVERAYAEADIYVMPSVSEPFGIAPLEALNVDVPVIVSRQSGVAEVLPSAPKVDYWDVRDLAGKILLLLERPELRDALARTGRREAEDLRWETCGARLVEVFREALRAVDRAPVGGAPVGGAPVEERAAT